MELIGLLFFGWIIYTFVKRVGYQEASAQSAVEPLKTSVSLNNENIDIHALAVDDEPDFIDKPDMLWTLEQFEKDNF